MRLEIKNVSVGDETPLDKWFPENRKIIFKIICVDIGEIKKKNSDRFFIKIATPDGLKQVESVGNIVTSRPLLIVKEYDFTSILEWIGRVINSCEGETWRECVEKLRFYFDWEFDGYKEI
ncbi:hypothetical protein C8234_05890 [Paracidovorax avenae]|uniref:Imm8 family immunity protein n=1 Tax=Paracidovorax avenae TaxID=80867 RepID=UPI000D1FF336|nr:Imm8 family immunity protein [Paracidovorax avenae]AVS77653.1 hypothetical protein C8234_05890 [Paracidovorax avenae]